MAVGFVSHLKSQDIFVSGPGGNTLIQAPVPEDPDPIADCTTYTFSFEVCAYEEGVQDVDVSVWFGTISDVLEPIDFPDWLIPGSDNSLSGTIDEIGLNEDGIPCELITITYMYRGLNGYFHIYLNAGIDGVVQDAWDDDSIVGTDYDEAVISDDVNTVTGLTAVSAPLVAFPANTCALPLYAAKIHVKEDIHN